MPGQAAPLLTSVIAVDSYVMSGLHSGRIPPSKWKRFAPRWGGRTSNPVEHASVLGWVRLPLSSAIKPAENRVLKSRGSDILAQMMFVTGSAGIDDTVEKFQNLDSQFAACIDLIAKFGGTDAIMRFRHFPDDSR